MKLRVSPRRENGNTCLETRIATISRRRFGPRAIQIRLSLDREPIISTATCRPISPAESIWFFTMGHRRIDKPAKGPPQNFCDTLIPTNPHQPGFRGIIVWGQGGGGSARFRCIGRLSIFFSRHPVEANWPTIAARFQRGGPEIRRLHQGRITIGLPLRTGKTDGHHRHQSRRSHGIREMLWHRFDTMIKRGCTMFYLDKLRRQLSTT